MHGVLDEVVAQIAEKLMAIGRRWISGDLIRLRPHARSPEEERSVELTENLGVQYFAPLLSAVEVGAVTTVDDSAVEERSRGHEDSLLILYFYGIFRSMISDLETEEFVDCLQRF